VPITHDLLDLYVTIVYNQRTNEVHYRIKRRGGRFGLLDQNALLTDVFVFERTRPGLDGKVKSIMASLSQTLQFTALIVGYASRSEARRSAPALVLQSERAPIEQERIRRDYAEHNDMTDMFHENDMADSEEKRQILEQNEEHTRTLHANSFFTQANKEKDPVTQIARYPVDNTGMSYYNARVLIGKDLKVVSTQLAESPGNTIEFFSV